MKTTKTSLIKFHSTVSGINLIYVAFNYPLLHFTICLMVNFVKHLYFGFHFFAPLNQNQVQHCRKKDEEKFYYFVVSLFRFSLMINDEPFIAFCFKIKQIIKLFHS